MPFFRQKSGLLSKKYFTKLGENLLNARLDMQKATQFSGIAFQQAEKAENNLTIIREGINKIQELETHSLENNDVSPLLGMYHQISSEAERMDFLSGQLFSLYNKLFEQRITETQKRDILRKIRFTRVELKEIQDFLDKKLSELQQMKKSGSSKSADKILEAEKKKILESIEEIHTGNRAMRRATLRFTRYARRMAKLVDDVVSKIRELLNKSYRR